MINYKIFLDFKKNSKIGLSPVGLCVLLTNARTFLCKTCEFFNIDPLILEEYFI